MTATLRRNLRPGRKKRPAWAFLAKALGPRTTVVVVTELFTGVSLAPEIDEEKILTLTADRAGLDAVPLPDSGRFPLP